MQDNLNEFIELFQKIKSAGYIRTHRRGNTGIGKTFEDACDIVENNLDEPDFKGIEIKSHRAYTSSYITLFTKAPTYPVGANTALRLKYGTPDSHYPEMKVLHTSCFGHRYNTHKSGYGFKMLTDNINQRVSFIAKDLATDEVVDYDVYWDYDVIKNIIIKKLQYIAFIEAKTRIIDGHEEFHFKKATLLSGFKFDRFLELLEKGYIMFDVRIGVYKTGRNAGKTHDHGSGFRINKRDLNLAFKIREL